MGDFGIFIWLFVAFGITCVSIAATVTAFADGFDPLDDTADGLTFLAMLAGIFLSVLWPLALGLAIVAAILWLIWMGAKVVSSLVAEWRENKEA